MGTAGDGGERVSGDNNNGHGNVLEIPKLDFTGKPFTETPPEDGAALLDEVEAFISLYVVLSEAQSAAIALWIAHTYSVKVSAWTPYLNVLSATASCGKSLLLETIAGAQSFEDDGASPAYLFRRIELDQPTLSLEAC
jgi:hypothetical protein